MFHLRTQPSSGRSTSMNQSTAAVSCLSVSCTHTFTLHPHQHRTCWDAPCVDGDTKWMCVCMIRQTDSLQQQCFGSQRWTSLTMAVAPAEICWNIVWLNMKFFELLYMHFVGSIFRSTFSLCVFLSRPPLHAASTTYFGPVYCVAASLCKAKNGSSRSECSKEIELWCDDCSDFFSTTWTA